MRVHLFVYIIQELQNRLIESMKEITIKIARIDIFSIYFSPVAQATDNSNFFLTPCRLPYNTSYSTQFQVVFFLVESLEFHSNKREMREKW